jgi:type IX secretion system PorP/SprF family membrane protein
MRLTFLLLYLLFCISAYGQQQFLFSQNKIAPVVFNPSCTGAPPEITGILVHRTQWANLDNSPVTSILSIHAPIDYYRLGVGVRIIQDDFFDFKTTSANALISYKIKVRNGYLSTGFSPGIKQFGYNQNRINPNNSSDPDFVALNNRWTKFDFGTGVFLFTERTHIGLCIQKTFGTPSEIKKQSQYSALIHGAHKFPIRNNNGIRISLQSRFAYSKSLTEGTISFENKNFWFGLGTRSNFDMVIISGIDLLWIIPSLRHNIRIAYAMDINASSSQLSQRPAHEIGIVTSIKPFKSKSSVKPSGKHLQIL